MAYFFALASSFVLFMALLPVPVGASTWGAPLMFSEAALLALLSIISAIWSVR